jgi:hypothetical protein
MADEQTPVPAKNVIFMLPDGASASYMANYRYFKEGPLHTNGSKRAAARDQAQDLRRNPLRSRPRVPRRLPQPAADLCQAGRLLLGLPRTPPRGRAGRCSLPARPRQAPLSDCLNARTFAPDTRELGIRLIRTDDESTAMSQSTTAELRICLCSDTPAAMRPGRPHCPRAPRSFGKAASLNAQPRQFLAAARQSRQVTIAQQRLDGWARLHNSF